MTIDVPWPPVAAHLYLVGRFACRIGDEDVRLTPTAERVLAFLALARRPVRRGQLAGTLWPDVTDRQALTRLRSALWKVPAPQRAALVEADATNVALHRGASVDLYALDDTGTDPAAQTDAAQTGTPLARGELLPGWCEEWVLVERERHRQLRLHALEARCARACAQGRYGEALSAGLEAVSQEPLRESAHRRVIEVHLAEGNSAEALGQYEGFRTLLRTELGLPPSPAIRALVRPLLGRPAD
ncbi:AfsR/SARP family transcriptional regulator [Actinomycetospora straminea]|uniref:Bacterial transcriptional activator domain-containing protein n=1 Tax=Actinomycetospora straminea TaxID=663607 RepID=A0ABP9FA97_9PSEU|nr:BTAD domain-containing putative transcriptional regulator [Actinomycetospora straminea]MDD7936674.1 BTAD domain-containing putative transcriptional regulator [Actinomycetospora straminea]